MNSIKPKIWLVCSILTNINRKQYFRLEQIWKLLFPRRKTITGNIRISLDYQCIWYFQYRSKISIIVTSFAVSPFWKQRFIRYCIVFKVEKAMKACKRSKDTSALHRGEIWYLTLCCHLGFGVIHLSAQIAFIGQEVCVSCESKASRPHLGDRCSGHGVHNKMTRSSI